MDSPKTMMDFMEMYKTEEDCRKAFAAPAAAMTRLMRIKSAPRFSAEPAAIRLRLPRAPSLRGPEPT